MPKSRKAPEKLLEIAAWGLAIMMFVALSATAFLQSRAADSIQDDALTSRENCQDSCNRDHTTCLESSGPRLENYGERTSTAGLDAGCNSSLRECLRQCGVISPSRQVPQQTPDTRGILP